MAESPNSRCRQSSPVIFSVPKPATWPEPYPWLDTRGYRRRVAKGWPGFQVAFRVEPAEGMLDDFGAAVIAATGVGEMASKLPEHRALYLHFQHVARDAPRAVDACTFQVKRLVKRIGIPIVRCTADTREIPNA